MSENLAAEYARLVKRYSDLADGIRMIRRAVERASHAGVLSSSEPVGITPLQECEAIARTIYRASVKHKIQGGTRDLTELTARRGAQDRGGRI